MAEKKYIKDVQKSVSEEKEKGKFGHFKTATGGGEPIPKGQKWTDEKRDPDQPRTADGKFTYNAVNGKELKEVSKVNGKSRGTTVPPTLTGGVNGVQYYEGKKDKNGHVTRDFDKGRVFASDDTLSRISGMKIDEIYHKGDGVVVKKYGGTIAKSPIDMVESAALYVANEKDKDKYNEAFKSIVEKRNKGEKITEDDISALLSSGHFKGDQPGSWEVHRAKTDKEKAAVEKAKTEGTFGKEMVEREPEAEKVEAPKETKEAPKTTSVKKEKAPEVEKGKYNEYQLKALSSLFEGETPTSAELEDMIARGQITEDDIQGEISKAVDDAKAKKAGLMSAIKSDPDTRAKFVERAKKKYGSELEGLEDVVIAKRFIDDYFDSKIKSLGE